MGHLLRDGGSIIYLCILVEKHGQSKLGQNCIFLNGSPIAGRREYKQFLEPRVIYVLCIS